MKTYQKIGKIIKKKKTYETQKRLGVDSNRNHSMVPPELEHGQSKPKYLKAFTRSGYP